MVLSHLKLVTFDVTGTLLKINKPIGEIYGEVARCNGISANYDKLTKNWRNTWKLMNKSHPNFGLYTGLGWNSWWKIYVSLTFKNALISINTDNASIEKIASELIELFSTEKCWDPTEGCVHFLESLVTRNIIMGVVSNFDPRLHKILENIGIKKYFSFIITSYESTFLKPDSRIFELAEKSYESIYNKKLQKLSILHVGDSITSDYIGAKSVGWNSVLLSDKDITEIVSKESTIDRTMVFRNLSEFNKYLFRK